jgi:hypothetical protein
MRDLQRSAEMVTSDRQAKQPVDKLQLRQRFTFARPPETLTLRAVMASPRP